MVTRHLDCDVIFAEEFEVIYNQSIPDKKLVYLLRRPKVNINNLEIENHDLNMIRLIQQCLST
jgi:hypothetical protein